MWYLTLVLLVALVMVAGKRGVIIFSSLAGSFLLLLTLIMLIADEFNPLIVGIIFAIILVFLAIYPQTQNPQVRQSALVSTLLVLVGLFLLVLLLVPCTASQGFSLEDTEEIEQFVLSVGVSFPQIQMVVILLSSLGAVAEASIAVSSGIWEIIAYQPQISVHNLWQAGLEIGRKNIATALNTLLFGFFGSYLTLGLWLIQLHYSLVTIFNNGILVTAVVGLLLGILGVIVVVLITNCYILWYYQHHKLVSDK